MIKIKEQDKNKVAVVIVGYNRLKPIQRLLRSLLTIRYEEKSVPLVISIDCSHNDDLYQYVRQFEWPFGNKYVNIQEERLGLRNHIIQCGDLTQLFRAVILLEDDVFVSEYFYDYTLKVLDAYEDDDRIGGFSLYSNDMCDINVPVSYYNDGSDCYLRQRPASWGECWTKSQWGRFKEWYDRFDDSGFVRIDMPEEIKKWEKAWTKYFMAYLIETDRYVVYPHLSLTTCFSDPGEHYELISMVGQYTLLHGERHYLFNPFEDMVSYDVYWTNNAIYQWVGLPKHELCVDWYGMSKNSRNCRFLLTPLRLPYKIIKSYGLYLRPIELNIKCEMEGYDIFLYDTEGRKVDIPELNMPMPFINYSVKGMNISMLRRYVVYDLMTKVKFKLKKMTKGMMGFYK